MAATVNAMIDRVAQQAGPDPVTGLWGHPAHRRADALHRLADGDQSDTLVVIHVDSDVVLGETDGDGLVGGVTICQETVSRFLCDTSVEHAVDGPDGTCIGIGRRNQAIPHWLRRQIIYRDRTCRFPGCGRPIRHIHHLAHWTRDQGPTDSHNLMGGCHGHHWHLHEGGWNATGNANDTITFTSPTGRQLTSRRQPTRRSTRSRVATALGIPLPDDGYTPTGPAP